MTAARRSVVLCDHWVSRPWGRLWVWRAGTGRRLVALHGLGASGRYWEGLASLVADRFTVVAPDLGGFGRSDKPPLAYDREFHLGNLDALLAAEGGEGANGPVVVVGHSMGGVLAALWAARRPERVAGLALVAAPFPAGAPVGSRRESGSHDFGPLQRRAFQAAQLLWPALAFLVRSRTFPRPIVRDFLRHTPSSYWGSARHLLWDDAAAAELEGLRELDVPVLLLTGAGDQRVPAADGERWAALLPAATARVVPGGHQLLLRSGFSVLAEWLAALPR